MKDSDRLMKRERQETKVLRDKIIQGNAFADHFSFLAVKNAKTLLK